MYVNIYLYVHVYIIMNIYTYKDRYMYTTHTHTYICRNRDIVIYKDFRLDVTQGRINGVSIETRTHLC